MSIRLALACAVLSLAACTQKQPDEELVLARHKECLIAFYDELPNDADSKKAEPAKRNFNECMRR